MTSSVAQGASAVARMPDSANAFLVAPKRASA